MKLSIAIITWNRSKQLVDALNSCCHCKLSKDTEFVIIDNASTDDTEEKVKHFFSDKIYQMYYEKMSENLGVGTGRNYAFSKSNGEYVYFLDDDAYIDNDKDFFVKGIDILDNHTEIMTLTTQIYDLMWKSNRVPENGPIIYENMRKCFMLCGGSHFLRKSFFKNTEPYFSNQYGYEELKPSLLVSDAGFLNAFTPVLTVVHNPSINKWNYNNHKNKEVLIKYVVNQFVLKSKMYPRICYPLCYGVYLYRRYKYLKNINSTEIHKAIIAQQNSYNIDKKLKIKTVYHLYRDFGISIF